MSDKLWLEDIISRFFRGLNIQANVSLRKVLGICKCCFDHLEKGYDRVPQ